MTTFQLVLRSYFLCFFHFLALLKSSICTTGVFFRSAMKCEQVSKLLDLVRYKSALSERALPFYDNRPELVKTHSWLERDE